MCCAFFVLFERWREWQANRESLISPGWCLRTLQGLSQLSKCKQSLKFQTGTYTEIYFAIFGRCPSVESNVLRLSAQKCDDEHYLEYFANMCKSGSHVGRSSYIRYKIRADNEIGHFNLYHLSFTVSPFSFRLKAKLFSENSWWCWKLDSFYLIPTIIYIILMRLECRSQYSPECVVLDSASTPFFSSSCSNSISSLIRDRSSEDSFTSPSHIRLGVLHRGSSSGVGLWTIRPAGVFFLMGADMLGRRMLTTPRGSELLGLPVPVRKMRKYFIIIIILDFYKVTK